MCVDGCISILKRKGRIKEYKGKTFFLTDILNLLKYISI